ncbi:MAG: 4-hydroxybenzoate octaprenyltransferase [Gammaproteobacteria bacterium]|nr:4-hydroxybenzoate octaprenyltransferase [Gammaproteobacteria bacterium]
MAPAVIERLSAYGRLIRLDRPVGTLLLLWPTLFALWLAGGGDPPGGILFVFVAGTFLMRSAGCALNDYADRRVDRLVKRTRSRPLATGEIKPVEALFVAALLTAAAALLVFSLGPLVIGLAVAGAAVAGFYPFAKRLFSAPQLVLGAAFSWGVPMAYAALSSLTDPSLWVLWPLTFLWVVIYDTVYAMVDRDDDEKIGVPSTAILLGGRDVAFVALGLAVYLAGMFGLGLGVGLGLPFLACWAGAVLCAGRQVWLIRGRDRARCLQAFNNNSLLGFLLYAGLALNMLLSP